MKSSAGSVRRPRFPARSGARLAFLVTWIWPLAAHAAGGGKPATRLVNVADTRDMAPGIGRWIADLYNDSMLLYAVTVVLVMAGVGLVLGLAFDRLMGLLGIQLGRLEHRE